MNLIQEYNNFYTKNPRQWANPVHDEYVLSILRSYDRPDKVLDIGCGNGHLLKYLSTHWPTAKRFDMEFWGLDFSPVAIELARKNVQDVEFVCASIHDLIIDKFDMLLCVGVAEHFLDPLLGLMACKSILQSNGILYLEVPNCLAYNTHNEGEGYFRIKRGSKQLEWHLLRSTWEDMIAEAGFRILENIKGPNPQSEFIWVLTNE